MPPPGLINVFAEEHADKSVTIWREQEKRIKLVFYPADCVEKPSRKYTLFIKLQTSARWAVKWIN